MLSTIQNFSAQFKQSIAQTKDSDLSALTGKPYQKIIVAAMGGSSLPTDLLNAYLAPKVHLETLRDYTLPSNIDANTLVICSSFSGNTEETLSCYEQALDKKNPILIISNGGKLKKLAQTNQTPYIQIPDCIQPRCASGYFLASLLTLLSSIGMIDDQEKTLLELADFLEEQKPRQEKLGQELAPQLKDRLPIIYSDSSFEADCRIWKIKMNENAKIQSWFNVIPELNHNEMVGYTQMNTQTSLVFLEHEGMHPSNQKRMAVMAKLLGDKIPIHHIQTKGRNFLQRLFDALLIGDYTSYYLAVAYGIDPTPVDMVEDFKKML